MVQKVKQFFKELILGKPREGEPIDLEYKPFSPPMRQVTQQEVNKWFTFIEKANCRV